MKVGILGAGQLGRMLVLAGYPLGLTFRLFDPAPKSDVSAVAPHTCAHYDDESALKEFASGLDAVTFEFENVPSAAVRLLEKQVPVRPGAEALETAGERFAEKRCFQKLGVRTSPFEELSADTPWQDRWQKIEKLGLPVVLKTRRLGYDGKGQRVIKAMEQRDEAEAFCRDVDVLAEKHVSFSRELSLVAVRSSSGELRFYPLVENVHFEGILRTSRCPAPRILPSLEEQAQSYARAILEHFNYVGVLTIEFFESEGQLLANEMAPRVHNSGHFSIEGAVTSQFENHLRAVCGLPLGSTALTGSSLMINLIGYQPDRSRILSFRDAHYHWYGKVPREGRKVGHVTLVSKTSEERESRAQELLLACRNPASSRSKE